MTRKEEPKTVYWMDNKLYLNITNLCSNCCYFCFRRYRCGVGGFNLKLSTEPTFDHIVAELSEVLSMRSWNEAVFCGFGEPTERLEVLLKVAKWIRVNYGRPMLIRLDTNGHGYLLNPGRDVAGLLKAAGLDKVNVSLNAGDRATYIEICKPTFPEAYEAVLDFIRKAKLMIEVEANAVRVPEVDLAKTQGVADSLGVKFRVRDYIPCFF